MTITTTEARKMLTALNNIFLGMVSSVTLPGKLPLLANKMERVEFSMKRNNCHNRNIAKNIHKQAFLVNKKNAIFKPISGAKTKHMKIT